MTDWEAREGEGGLAVVQSLEVVMDDRKTHIRG